MLRRATALVLASLVASVLMPGLARAQVVDPPPSRKTLPQEHEYQKTLYNYLGTLTEKDFEHGVTEKFTTPELPADPDEQYSYWIMTKLIQPLIGTKRGAPAVTAPPRLFLLSALETPEGVMQPPLWTEQVGFLVSWKYPGNPYYDSRAMKLRAFVTMYVHLVMLDDAIESKQEPWGRRRDLFAPSLLLLSRPYPAVRGVLPEEVQQAYLTGLRKMGQRMLEWSLPGEDPHLALVAPVALWDCSQALQDPEFTKQAEAYARRLFTDPQYHHPAGFFIDRGGIDLGYAGTGNFFAAWTALASNWDFAREAVASSYRLRAHLCLPEPDGRFIGPSHFHTRYSADASGDQWAFDGYRDTAASLVTDEAMPLTTFPKPEELADAAASRARSFQGHINENGVVEGRFITNDEIKGWSWKWRQWQSWHFPANVSFAFEHYPRGAFARRAELERTGSPLLKSPFLRDEMFIRDFEKAFTVAKQPTYAAIVHTGPVGDASAVPGAFVQLGPYGFGGGQLSAFWTQSTGAVLLGRRGGMSKEKNFDPIEDWRLWPLHAVTGISREGVVFTTGRVRQPDVVSDVASDRGLVRVSGELPAKMLGQDTSLAGPVHYARTFHLEPNGVKVETSMKLTGRDTLAELYETLPVFLREQTRQPTATPTTIEFQREGAWSSAGTAWTAGVTAIRLVRFTGAVVIIFDRPRRVRLSAADWVDGYLSRASCRNVLIDLIEQNDQPTAVTEVAVSYRIESEQGN